MLSRHYAVLKRIKIQIIIKPFKVEQQDKCGTNKTKVIHNIINNLTDPKTNERHHLLNSRVLVIITVSHLPLGLSVISVTELNRSY